MSVQPTGKMHVIIIARDDREQPSPFIVVPGRQPAEKGDSIFFKNVTNEAVSIEFDAATPVGEKTIPLDAHKGDTKMVGDVALGSYPYEIYCGPNRTLAYGSKPIIIIYDKIP